MPLLDHFHPPLSERRHWESFHASWANEIMAALNQGGLPPGYFAETQVHFGSRVEIDVASFHQAEEAGSNGRVAVEALAALRVMKMPAVFPDEIEIQIYRRSGGATLVGAIELVSPGNNDRAEKRRAFAAKCLGYLQMGIGLLVVDIVTELRANLHNDLVELMGQAADYRFPGESPLYSVSYQPVRTEAEGDQIEVRPVDLHVGQLLPAMPLALRGGPVVRIELEETYTQTRKRSQL
jgi:hypothetical protein